MYFCIIMQILITRTTYLAAKKKRDRNILLRLVSRWRATVYLKKKEKSTFTIFSVFWLQTDEQMIQLFNRLSFFVWHKWGGTLYANLLNGEGLPTLKIGISNGLFLSILIRLVARHELIQRNTYLMR